jgi:hypothetical protein
LVGKKGLKDARAKAVGLALVVQALVRQLRGAIGADVVELAAAGPLALEAVAQLELRQRLAAVGQLANICQIRQLQPLYLSRCVCRSSSPWQSRRCLLRQLGATLHPCGTHTSTRYSSSSFNRRGSTADMVVMVVVVVVVVEVMVDVE